MVSLLCVLLCSFCQRGLWHVSFLEMTISLYKRLKQRVANQPSLNPEIEGVRNTVYVGVLDPSPDILLETLDCVWRSVLAEVRGNLCQTTALCLFSKIIFKICLLPAALLIGTMYHDDQKTILYTCHSLAKLNIQIWRWQQITFFIQDAISLIFKNWIRTLIFNAFIIMISGCLWEVNILSYEVHRNSIWLSFVSLIRLFLSSFILSKGKLNSRTDFF